MGNQINHHHFYNTYDTYPQKFPYRITTRTSDYNQEIEDWLSDNISDWCIIFDKEFNELNEDYMYRISFLTEEEAVFFKLRWGVEGE